MEYKLRKIKVLMVNECSYLSTGYSVYGRNLLTQLMKDDRFEIAEMGTFFSPHHNKLHTIPWKFYPNAPPQNSSQEIIEQFARDKAAQMGYAMFNQIALDFKPDVTLVITDFWCQKFINNSPYRKCFKSLWMAPHDSIPQNIEWLEDMVNHDGVLGYTDWAVDEIRKAAPKVNLLGSAPPCAEPEFASMNKEDLKKAFGLDSNNKFIGTTMRNQFRKLFPNLFEAFRKFLDVSGRDDIYLYAHTSYPDGAWNIPELIQYYNVAHKVLFTYICHNCENVFPSFYTDIATCKRCGEVAGKMTSTQKGVTTKTLAGIYNIFDCYVQYSNSEGFGMPMVEATNCGIPLMSVDYSAMSDVVRKVGGQPIKVIGLQTEMKTGCKRALPDDNHLVELLIKFFNKPQSIRNIDSIKTRTLTLKEYNWEKTAEVWKKAILSFDYKDDLWYQPIKRFTPADYQEFPNLGNQEYVRWLLEYVANRPDKFGSVLEANLIRDLNFGMRITEDEISKFFRKQAWEEMKRFGDDINIAEQIRSNDLDFIAKQEEK
jgi:glycosyltransferase involved in cell wall biosynthesis